jgi:general secretion pathway protein G
MRYREERGFTLVELLVTVTIVAILAGLAIPLARNTIIRRKEVELRRCLREMRVSIDRFKEAADQGLIEVSADGSGYPPSLDVLVDGVELTSAEGGEIKFLRRICVDPMTNNTNWGTRSSSDSPGLSGGGQDVFDVFSRSDGVAMDGTRYADW